MLYVQENIIHIRTSPPCSISNDSYIHHNQEGNNQFICIIIIISQQNIQLKKTLKEFFKILQHVWEHLVSTAFSHHNKKENDILTALFSSFNVSSCIPYLIAKMSNLISEQRSGNEHRHLQTPFPTCLRHWPSTEQNRWSVHSHTYFYYDLPISGSRPEVHKSMTRLPIWLHQASHNRTSICHQFWTSDNRVI